jgi:hypothetical protein
MKILRNTLHGRMVAMKLYSWLKQQAIGNATLMHHQPASAIPVVARALQDIT